MNITTIYNTNYYNNNYHYYYEWFVGNKNHCSLVLFSNESILPHAL